MTTETAHANASRLILDTTKGQIEIEFKPDLAPFMSPYIRAGRRGLL